MLRCAFSLRAIVFLLCSVVAAPMAAAASPEEETQQYVADLTEGISLLRTGNRDEVHRSIAKFKSALKLRPESAEAYYWIALAYSDLNNPLRAADNAKDATIYDDRMGEAWLLWGQILLYQRNWEEALKKLDQASRLEPENPLVLYNLGRVYYHGFNDPDTALPKFRAVWQKSPTLRRENPENTALVLSARLYMGYCEYDRGRWENAINAFREVLHERPLDYETRLRLAIAYRRFNRPSECEAILLDLLKGVPQDTPANRELLAEANLQLGDLYLKDPVFNNIMYAIIYLREFVNSTRNLAHPMLEPAREFLAKQDRSAAES